MDIHVKKSPLLHCGHTYFVLSQHLDREPMPLMSALKELNFNAVL